MNRALYLLVLCAAAWLAASCAQDEDVQADGDVPQPCAPGERLCDGDQVRVCGEGGTFEPDRTCESPQVCHLGVCVVPATPRFDVQRLSLDSPRDVTLDFEKAGARYLLALFSTRARTGTSGYRIESGEGCPPDLPALTPANAVPLRDEASWVSWRGRAVRLERLAARRQADRALWEARRHRPRVSPLPPPDPEPGCVRSDACPEGTLCEKGECQAEIPLVFDAWNTRTTLRASVVARGDRCAILLDTDNRDALTPDQAARLLDACDRLIVPRGRAFFGEPILEGEEGPSDVSDRDGDGLLHLLFSSKVNDEGVWGFFNSADYWFNEDNDSNERDILYVSLPESDAELPSLEATIVHEYQHLLHFVMHNWLPRQRGENPDYNPVWLDEALAHLAEEITGFGADNPKLVRDFLADFGNVALTSGGDTLKRRGMGMLLLLYLFEQAGGVVYGADGSVTDRGGAAFLRGILSHEGTGMESLEEQAGRDFAAFYGDWLVTLVAPESGVTPAARYRYDALRTDPVSGAEIGVLTHGERTNPAGETFTLNGPRRDVYVAPCTEEALRAGGAQLFRVEAGNETRLRLTLSADDPDTHGVLIRLW